MSALEDTLAKYDRMASEMESSRAVNREAIYRVVLLSASIVGFSATLLSIKALKLNVDSGLLELSWVLFAAVILIGPLSIFVESRARYAITWRSIQPQHFENRKATWNERAKLFGVVLYTVFIRPRNLIFARDTDFGNKVVEREDDSEATPCVGYRIGRRACVLADLRRSANTFDRRDHSLTRGAASRTPKALHTTRPGCFLNLSRP